MSTAPDRVVRLNGGAPIIDRAWMLAAGADEDEAGNINGPTVVELPDWIPSERRVDPAARFYAYFAHHGGRFIRLAWAADPVGPWQPYRMDLRHDPQRGVFDLGPPPHDGPPRLPLGPELELHSHIASPEIQFDPVHRRVVLYLHAPVARRDTVIGQYSFAATSDDGLDFHGFADQRGDGHGLRRTILCPSYLRTCWLRGRLYGMTSRGQIALTSIDQTTWAADPDSAWHADSGHDPSTPWWRSSDGPLTRFLTDHRLDPPGDPPAPRRGRHVALRVAGDRLEILYSAVGDAPERILRAEIDTAAGDDPADWHLTAVDQELLRPELPWEGADIRERDGGIIPSRSGSGVGLNQLRDPALLETDGRRFLYYTGAGEAAIGVAELLPS